MHKFAFIIHPIEIRDVARKFGIASRLPDSVVERLVRLVPPMKASHITGVRSAHSQTEGWFVGCPLTSRQMLALPEAYVLKRIIQTGRLAERLGAEIVGLGAMTSVVGDAGLTIAKNLNIAVTSGNSYTVATAIEGAKQAAGLMDIDMGRAEVVILGATGAIGSVCAQILARDCRHLTLVGRNQERLQQLAERVRNEAGVSARISQSKEVLKQADLIIAVTAAVDTVIGPEDLKPGAVVCDVARPRDVSKQVAEKRDDVLIIEGGVVEVPGEPNFNFDFGFPPGLSYACMAETMILALEGRIENFTLGRDLSVAQVDEISQLAAKHGFRLAGFRSFERPVTAQQIEAIRERARQQLAG